MTNPPPSMQDRLDRAIAEFVEPLVRKRGFRARARRIFDLGAWQDYTAGNLLIRIINDKGIVAFEVAPQSRPDNTLDLALIKEYREPPKRGVLNLSLREQADFLDANWQWLNDAFSAAKCNASLTRFAAAAERRRRRLFGG